MNIIHTESSCGWGGQEIRILEESRGLIERGHIVQVLCPAESHIFEEAPKRGVPSIALPIGRKSLKGFFALRNWIKNNKVDVINTHSSTDTWLVALANTTITAPPPLIRTRHISASVPRNFASRWLYTKATKHIVTTGNALKEQLVKNNGFPEEMITSIPTGIDTKRFHPGDRLEAKNKLNLPIENRYIGIVATLRSWKGHLYLLEAFATLDLPEWKLLIVGDGPMQKPIKEKIQALNITDRVIMTGQQKNPEEWLRAMDIFCLPSYANEGVPQAILQAMLTELPIITTSVGAILDAVTDNKSALIINPKNHSEIRKAIMKIINDHELSSMISKNSRKKASAYFSHEIMINSMSSIFNNLTSKTL